MVRGVQAVLITILLTLTYLLGFGLTALILLPRRLVRRSSQAKGSLWVRAREDAFDEESTSRQS